MIPTTIPPNHHGHPFPHSEKCGARLEALSARYVLNATYARTADTGIIINHGDIPKANGIVGLCSEISTLVPACSISFSGAVIVREPPTAMPAKANNEPTMPSPVR